MGNVYIKKNEFNFLFNANKSLLYGNNWECGQINSVRGRSNELGEILNIAVVCE